MDYKTSYSLHKTLIYVALALFLPFLFLRSTWVLVLILILVLADGIQTAVFYRCPRCGTMLDPRAKLPNYCPQCGCELDGRST